MKNLKWFWRINYCFTIYSTVLLVGNILDIALGYDKDGYSFLQKYSKYYMIGNNDFMSIFYFCIEWLQIPLILGILIWKKQERISVNWFYLLFLFILTISKIVIYFTAIGGWMLNQA